MSKLWFDLNEQSAKLAVIPIGSLFQVRDSSGGISMAQRRGKYQFVVLGVEDARLIPVTIEGDGQTRVLMPTHEVV